MISLESLRKMEPEFEHMSDEELSKIHSLLYEYATLAIEVYLEKRVGSKKSPKGIAIEDDNVPNYKHE